MQLTNHITTSFSEDRIQIRLTLALCQWYIYLTFFNLPRPATAATATTTILLLLLLLRNASDLRNCTSYFGACMWVWYCRPPIGAHFHPTPQPLPVPQQLGEKAHLRTVAAVLANATATTLVYPSMQGPTPARRPAPACTGCRPAPACGPACAGPHTRGLTVERRLVQATAVRRSHSSCNC